MIARSHEEGTELLRSGDGPTTFAAVEVAKLPERRVRARIPGVRDWRDYPHTRVFVELEAGLAFARKHRAFLYDVPYKRYEQQRDEGRGT